VIVFKKRKKELLIACYFILRNFVPNAISNVIVHNYYKPMNFQLKLNQKLIDLSSPVVMGIVNVTPDSFYKGSRFTYDSILIKSVEKMLENGAIIIDIGGYSTRPGAEIVSIDEEVKRLSDGLDIILKKFPDIFISVDTFRAGVARQMVKNFDVAIINDISGGTLDNLMFETVADLQVAYVLMHTRGNPSNMRLLTQYENVVSEVMQFLEKRLAQLRFLGASDIIIDPGFGFAKTIEQNYELLYKLSYFQQLNAPILAGLSRKSMLYKSLNISADEALNATTAANMLALIGGASILRVHDVKEAMEAIQIFNLYNLKSNSEAN
jgi:dihydropteroate synthase